MSTGESQSSFVPCRDVEELLEVLRKAAFPWLADEIDLTIQQGHDVEKTRLKVDRQRDKLPAKYTDVVPFDESEQEAILVTALHRYFVELPNCLRDAEKHLKATLHNRRTPDGTVDVAVTRPGSEFPIRLFEPQFDSMQTELENLLRKAWPLRTEIFVGPK
jgi:hypothetical protein